MNALTLTLLCLVCLVGGVALGYAVCLVGTYARVHRQESNIRALVNSIDVLMDMDDEVPPQWVKNQLATMLAKEFR